jgi:hypothetical protein
MSGAGGVAFEADGPRILDEYRRFRTLRSSGVDIGRREGFQVLLATLGVGIIECKASDFRCC